MPNTRVMIVDDEPVIRKGLMQFIDWSAAQCDVVYGAVDGDDAWNNLATTRPDIVISDIRMPGRSGLELVRDIAAEYPWIKVILLTGHADFQYAQQAIHYNVVDFLLKPTQKPLVMEALAKARDLIEKDEERRRIELSLAGHTSLNNRQQLDDCLRSLISGRAGSDPVLSADLDRQLNQFYLLLVEAAPAGESPDARRPPSEDVGKGFDVPEFLKLVGESFPSPGTFLVPLRSDQVAVVSSFPDDQVDPLQTAIDRSEEMVKLAETFLRIRLSIGLSRCHSRTSEIAAAFSEAADALTVGAFAHDSHAVHLPRAESPCPLDMAEAQSAVESIMGSVRIGEGDSATAKLVQLFDSFRECHYALEDEKDVCILLASLCTNLATDDRLKTHKGNGEQRKHYSRILEAGTLPALFDILKPLIERTAELQHNDDLHSNSIILKSEAYLRAHFAERISLNQIADHVHVSPSYLSRLFHRETGQTLVDVLKTIRLNQACQLLKTTDLKSYEVATKVGIDDPAYFSQLFRKHTGMSPTDYRQKHR